MKYWMKKVGPEELVKRIDNDSGSQDLHLLWSSILYTKAIIISLAIIKCSSQAQT
jgi:hypothetical protein